MRRPRHVRVLAVLPVCALALAAGCTDADTGAAQPPASTATTTATTTAQATTGAVPEEATDTPPFPADVSADTAEAVPGEGPTVVTGIRAASQDGFGRVVIDISGTEVPGWDVQYVDTAYGDPSGLVIDVPGSVYLQMYIGGVDELLEGTGVTEVTGGPVVAEVGPVAGFRYASTYQGLALVYIGTTGERPFRVFSLTDPTRIVVDVQD